jgi:hypothetical protein
VITQMLLALQNPQLGIAALVVVALTIASIRIYRYRSQMDPELARVRALEKIINRTLPRFGRKDGSVVDDCLKSAITALATPTSTGAVSDESTAADDSAALDDP